MNQLKEQTWPADDPWASLIEPLAECRAPLLIGVRHHSAALARAVPDLLDSFAPEAVLIELPSDLSDWLRYLVDPETVAPVALSAAMDSGGLFFYPLADFSPELVAMRWAARHGVPLVACDLAVAARPAQETGLIDAQDQPESTAHGQHVQNQRHASAGILDQLLSRTGSSDTGQLWERLVEAPAVGQTAEAVRRAALLFGWAVRAAQVNPALSDRYREAAMRRAVREAPARSAAVIGSFHAAALLPEVIQAECKNDYRNQPSPGSPSDAPAVSLVPYSFSQLDERSGYPAGILDPVWHQMVSEARSIEDMDRMSVALATDICRHMRGQGQAAGTPEAMEIVRMMRDLARLRGLSAAGRGELIEAIQSCLVQGELYGRGRAVARAAEKVLVGNRRGRLAPGVPKCGLQAHLEDLLARLNLPGPASYGDQPREVRLDVLRNARDRARAVVLRMMDVAQITYASRVDSIEQGARENITERWKVQWQHGTSAMAASASRYGVTLAQVVEAVARGNHIGHDLPPGEIRPELIVQRLHIAAECGLHHLVNQTLGEITGPFLRSANIPQLVAAASWIGRIAAGHAIGLPLDRSLEYPPLVRAYRLPDGRRPIEPLLRACLDRLSGMEGSDQREDVAGLVDLVYWFTGDLSSAFASAENSLVTCMDLGADRLRHWCRNTVRRGSERMRGAAAGMLGVLGDWHPEQMAALMAGWLDGATHREGRRRLRYGLAGAAQVLLPLAQTEPSWFDGLEDGFRRMSDERFLERLAALRGGFSELAPADRRRLLDARLAHYDERGTRIAPAADGLAAEDATWQLAAWRAADLEGRKVVEQLLPDFFSTESSRGKKAVDLSKIDADEYAVTRSQASFPAAPLPAEGTPPGTISLADRWRLVLAVTEAESPRARAAARCLDQLYGYGSGEGAGDRLTDRRAAGSRGGVEAPAPTIAEWADDLEKLLGSDVCQEVLGEAAGAGQAAAAELLDPDRVQPSIELLQQVLALAGGLPEARAEKLRRLARRVTEQLAQQLAQRLQPSLAGLSTPRPTRRRSRRLNLGRTVRDNLARVYRRQDGRPAIVAERLIFHSPARRQMDWHLTFVVDVSGSMTESVVYSALVAAIFAELPALSVRFLAFSTEVVDLSGKVSDPLALLLQVQVGGGTHIGLGLRAARAGLKSPSRSIVVLVSDFEEGVSVGEMVGEVRGLVSAGTKCVGLAALDDSGTARFHQGYAQLVAAAGMPVAAVSPENLARWVGDQIRGQARSGGGVQAGPVGASAL